MRNLKRKMVILAALPLVVVGSLLISRTVRTPGQAPAPSASQWLFIDDTKLDFGTPWESEAFVWTLPIENRSARSIQIVEFMRSCSCLNVEPHKAELSPGETLMLKATLNLLTPLGKDSMSNQATNVEGGVPAKRVAVSLAAKYRFC